MRSRIAFLLALLITLPRLSASATAPTADALRSLEAAAAAADADAVLAARATFGALAAADPTSVDARYGIAVACWRATPLLERADSTRARKVCRDGLAACEAGLALAPDDADLLAIRASLQGLWLGFEPAQTMTLGMAMEEAIGRASGRAPTNPRVQFLKALHTLHKPAFLGGGPERAREEFAKAIALHAAAAPHDPRAWGHADAHLWAGRVAMKLGDPAAALEHYAHALERAPDHVWIAKSLGPEAVRAQAAKAKP